MSMSSNTTSYAPMEPPIALESEMINFTANIIGQIGFGMNLWLYLETAYIMFTNPRRQRHWRIFFAFVTVIMILNIYKTVVYARGQELSYIYMRNAPGGPLAASQIISPLAWNRAEFFLTFIEMIIQDGLYVFRYYLFVGPVLYMLAPMYTLYFASIVVMILYVEQFQHPGSIVKVKPGDAYMGTAGLGYAFWIMSIALNIIITIVIVVKITQQRRKIQTALGQQYGEDLRGVAAMLVESAAIYTIPATAFLITYLIKTPWINFTSAFVNPSQAIATLLIVKRVARGRAWTRDEAGNGELLSGTSTVCPECSQRRSASSRGPSNHNGSRSTAHTIAFNRPGAGNLDTMDLGTQTGAGTGTMHGHGDMRDQDLLEKGDTFSHSAKTLE